MQRGFTLIEILIVMAIVSTVVAIVFLVLNPVEYVRRARDAQRLRDYTFIKQAVGYYLYSASVDGRDPDLDGPAYSDSCVGQPASKLFVSVPQNEEPDPAPSPDGWTYNRVPPASLYSVSGSGWLPLDFSSLGGSVPSLTKLPVDPVNTFASGYYYTYTCGSYEINLRFESEKYRTLAQTDGGDDDGVFETGIVLTTAPYQAKYHPAVSVAGTLALSPSGFGFNSGWTGSYTDIDDPKGTPNDSDRIYSSALNASSTFAIQDGSTSGGGQTITAVRLVLRANKVGLNSFQISPRIRIGGQNWDSAPISLTTTYTNYTVSFASNPISGNPWTWANVDDLQAGVLLTAAGASGSAQVSQMYIEVDYE